MIIRNAVFGLLVLTGGFCVAQQTAFEWKNPLRFEYTEGQTAPRTEVRDPCIIRESGRYYMTFTMWPFRNREEKHLHEPNQGGSPGIALYSSSDLKDWRFENWLVKADTLPEDCPYKNRFWAPELHKINGKFYLVFTADNWLKGEYNKPGKWGTAGYAFIGVADKVTGPYEHITWIEGGPCDMSLFGDDDGNPLLMKAEDHAYEISVDVAIDDGTEAGLLLFFNPTTYVGLKLTKQGFFTGLRNCLPQDRVLRDGVRRAVLKIRNDENIVEFFISEDNGQSFRKIGVGLETGGFHANTFGGYSSLKPGIFSIGEGKAVFRDFRYVPLPAK